MTRLGAGKVLFSNQNAYKHLRLFEEIPVRLGFEMDRTLRCWPPLYPCTWFQRALVGHDWQTTYQAVDEGDQGRMRLVGTTAKA